MRLIPSLLAVAAVVACSDSFKPTTENVMGDYSVRTFQTTDTSGTIDWIQRGGTLTISLGRSGITTGHIFVPGAGEGGVDFDQILIGDWSLSGNTITFDMPAVDTFIRDMPWTVTENTLSGDHTFSGTRIRVVLTK
jgi:hypothetical protein